MSEQDKPKELVAEFADALADMSGPRGAAMFMAEANGWADAFHAGCQAVDSMPAGGERSGAEAVVRAIYKAMLAKGIQTMTPFWVTPPAAGKGEQG